MKNRFHEPVKNAPYFHPSRTLNGPFQGPLRVSGDGSAICSVIAMSQVALSLVIFPIVENNVRGAPGPHSSQWISGAATKSRTRDLLITNQLLYQLSYSGNNLY